MALSVSISEALLLEDWHGSPYISLSQHYLEASESIVACFYIRFPDEQNGDYYRAVHLTERTVRDLLNKVSDKYKIDPDRIIRILCVNREGLRIMVDDDVVQQLPEGQDMVAEITETSKLEVTTSGY